MDLISHSANQSPLKQQQSQQQQQAEFSKHTTTSHTLNEDNAKSMKPSTHSNRGLDAQNDICYPYEFEGTTTANRMTETGRSDRTTTTTGHLRSAPVQHSQPVTQPPQSQTTPKTAQATALLPVLLNETEESRMYSVLNHRFTVDKRFKLLKGLGVGAYGVVW